MEAQQPIEEKIVGEDHRCTSPHGAEHAHLKNVKRGTERRDRQSPPGVPLFPKKAGKGGKFTWEGPEGRENDYGEEAEPVAIDEKDPNYVDEEEEKRDREVASGVVEVAKLAPHDIAVVDLVLPEGK